MTGWGTVNCSTGLAGASLDSAVPSSVHTPAPAFPHVLRGGSTPQISSRSTQQWAPLAPLTVAGLFAGVWGGPVQLEMAVMEAAGVEVQPVVAAVAAAAVAAGPGLGN